MPLKVQLSLLTIGLELYQLGVHIRAKKFEKLLEIIKVWPALSNLLSSFR